MNGISVGISAKALAEAIKIISEPGELLANDLKICIPIYDQTPGSPDSVFCEILFNELNK